MSKFDIGDVVWFPFDNGTREQTGVIQNAIYYVSFEDDYIILGNVDGKLYTKHESELNTTAPHKRHIQENDMRRCSNCHYYDYSLNAEPCCNCDIANHTKWKPVTSLRPSSPDPTFCPGDKVFYNDGTYVKKGVIKSVHVSYVAMKITYEIDNYITKKIDTVDERCIMLRIPKEDNLDDYDLAAFANSAACRKRGSFIPEVEKVDYRSFYPVTTGLSTNPMYDAIRRRILTGLSSDPTWRVAQSAKSFGLNVNVTYVDDILKEDNNMKKKQQNQRRRNRNVIKNNGTYSRDINEIIFNGPATIIKWSPSMDQLTYNKKGDKTVAVCGKDDKFDKTTGFLLAIIKEFFDNQSYDNILRKIDSFKEEEKQENEVSNMLSSFFTRFSKAGKIDSTRLTDKEPEAETVKDVWDSLPEKEKDIITDDISKAIRKKIRDDFEEEINKANLDPEYRPEQKFYMFDTVTFKSKGSHHYTVDNYRWNAEHKCWEYRIYNHVSHRWYEESRLVLVQRAININDIVRIGGSLLMHRVVDKTWNSVKGQHEYTLVQVGDPTETKITRLYSDLKKLYDSSSEIAKHFRVLA